MSNEKRTFLHGLLSDIQMNQKQFSVFCKHKHMLKKGAPPDNYGVVYPLLSLQFYGLNSQINKVIYVCCKNRLETQRALLLYITGQMAQHVTVLQIIIIIIQ